MAEQSLTLPEGNFVRHTITTGPDNFVTGSIQFLGGTAVPGQDIGQVDQQTFVARGAETASFFIPTFDNGLFDADKTFDYETNEQAFAPDGSTSALGPNLVHVTIHNVHEPEFTVSLDNNGVVPADDPVGAVVGHITPTNIAPAIQDQIQYLLPEAGPFAINGTNIVVNGQLQPNPDPSTLTVEALYPPTGVTHDVSTSLRILDLNPLLLPPPGTPPEPIFAPIEEPAPTEPPTEPTPPASTNPIAQGLEAILRVGQDLRPVEDGFRNGHVDPAAASQLFQDLVPVLAAGATLAVVAFDPAVAGVSQTVGLGGSALLTAIGAAQQAGSDAAGRAGSALADAFNSAADSFRNTTNQIREAFNFTPQQQ